MEKRANQTTRASAKVFLPVWLFVRIFVEILEIEFPVSRMKLGLNDGITHVEVFRGVDVENEARIGLCKSGIQMNFQLKRRMSVSCEQYRENQCPTWAHLENVR